MERNVGKEENASLDFLSEVECVELEHELAYSACLRHCSAKQECSAGRSFSTYADLFRINHQVCSVNDEVQLLEHNERCAEPD